MEKRLKFVVMLSLKEIALRKGAVLLSNDMEISLSFDADLERWLNTREDKVNYKTSKLLLPESLRKEIVDKVRPICLEIRKWATIHDWIEISTGEIDFKKFCWTTAGTIDYKKSAKALLGCEVLDIETRYELACDHCLEDYIPLLWEQLADERKEYFHSGTNFLPSLIDCWPFILKSEFSDLDRLWRKTDRNLTSFNQWAFEDSARKRNNTAAEFFYQKLTHEEKQASVMRTTLYVLSDPPSWDYFGSYYDNLCYLLSLMSPEQQMETIKEYPVHILLCFCVMFWQDLLVENAFLIWPSLSTSGYYDLLLQIIEIVDSDFGMEYKNLYHPKTLREFFIMSPLDFKKYFIHHEWICRFLKVFIRKEDSDFIECIFRNVDVPDRAAIVFNPKVLDLFCERLEDGRHMVEVCLREAKLSKEDRERLKIERPYLRRVIEELYESDATADKEKKGARSVGWENVENNKLCILKCILQ